MHGDFSRLTFDPTKQYSGVRMQQGRVQLDADWNEQMDILMHRLETEVADFIGPSGVPADVNDGKSFQITVAGNDLQVALGRIYLAGKLFENASDQTISADQLPQENGDYIAYLDAWQNTVSALEEPAIREVALGGADTTVRVKNVWRVRFAKSTEGAPLALSGMVRSTGKLRAHHDGASALGNQLYRVEIHSGGAAGSASYKWSRENGSVATTLETIHSASMITVSSAGRDTRLDFAAGHWVELLTPKHAQQGEAGALLLIQKVEGRTLTLANDNPLPQEIMNTKSPAEIIVRRWEGTGTIPANGGVLTLENGITIAFQTTDEQGKPVTYSQGDYWLLPTRALTGQLEWLGDFQPPQGIRHYYAQLARLRRGGSGSWRILEDLRITFKPQDKGFVSKTGDTMTGLLKLSDAGLQVNKILSQPGSPLNLNSAGDQEVIVGKLKVTGDIITGTLKTDSLMTGSLTTGSLNTSSLATGPLSAGPLTVGGMATLNSGLSVTGPSTLHGDLTVDADRNVKLGGSLTVSGATTMNGLSVNGDLTTAAGKNVTLGGSLTVSGVTVLNKPLTINNVGGSGATLEVNGRIKADSLEVGGDVKVNQSLFTATALFKLHVLAGSVTRNTIGSVTESKGDSFNSQVETNGSITIRFFNSPLQSGNLVFSLAQNINGTVLKTTKTNENTPGFLVEGKDSFSFIAIVMKPEPK